MFLGICDQALGVGDFGDFGELDLKAGVGDFGGE